ncbi:lipopolysaccharide transport periplasmic protein LptA [Mariprofundus erugo]|uniref:LptA/OstA family protein n=1 Tax=Mariprofundus erugo TaxID=2528639 RepID=UPI0010FE8DB1|nr:LptA/OstA family protein [Mariprofundus erugo]TLS76693.1 lipopolysaccharide transport periplasmic protein LptA [Mariprofundus erugo]
MSRATTLADRSLSFIRGKHSFRLLPLLLAGIITYIPAPLWAANNTVQIDAERMNMFHKDNRVEFFGKVHLVRDTMVLDCDHLTAYYVDNKLTHADAEGHVVIVQDKVHGHSNKARLDQLNGKLTLSGKAVLDQDGNRIEGETIVHDMNRKDTVVTPGESGRIHMRIESDEGNNSVIVPGTGAGK